MPLFMIISYYCSSIIPMSNPFKNVLVVGVTGGIDKRSFGVGSYIVDALIKSEKDWNINVLIRPESLQDEKKRERVSYYREKGVTVFEGDVLKPETLPPALKDVQLVISCLSGSSMFQHDGEINLIRASKEAGVTRFVLSGWTFNCWETPGVYLYDVKIHSLNLLKKLGLEYTIFDTIWYECILSDRSLIGINADENKAVIAEGGNTKVSGIGLNDVGKLAIEALLLPESKNAHLQLSAEEHTINEWVSIYEEITGKKLNREYITLEQLKKRSQSSLNYKFYYIYVSEAWRVHFIDPFNKKNEYLARIPTESSREYLRRTLNK